MNGGECATEALDAQMLTSDLAKAREARGDGLMGPRERGFARLPAAQGREGVHAGVQHELQVKDDVTENT